MTSLASDDSALTSRVARSICARMASTCSSSGHWCDVGNAMSLSARSVASSFQTDHVHWRLTLPRRNVNNVLPLHFAAVRAYVVCTTWAGLRRRGKCHDRLSPVYHGLHFTHSPLTAVVCCQVVNGWMQTVEMVIMWTALTAVSKKYRTGCHGQEKYLPIRILPNNNNNNNNNSDNF